MKTIIICLLLISTSISSAYHFRRIFEIFRLKPLCPIKLYDPNDRSFTGVPIYGNIITFHPLLRTLSTYAYDCDVIINVKQSFVYNNSMTNIDSQFRSHADYALELGKGIEYELFDGNNRLLCNQSCIEQYLARLSDIPSVKCFFTKLMRDEKLRFDPTKPNFIIDSQLSKYAISELTTERQNLHERCKKVLLAWTILPLVK